MHVKQTGKREDEIDADNGSNLILDAAEIAGNHDDITRKRIGGAQFL
jgi:hypothetical protein